jgi:hypothetical protein
MYLDPEMRERPVKLLRYQGKFLAYVMAITGQFIADVA